MNIYDSVSKHLKLLNIQITKVYDELKHLPEGSLRISSFYSNGKKYDKWRVFSPSENKLSNLPKSERTLAQKYARRTYLESLLKDLENQQYACELFLKIYPTDSANAEKVLSNAGLAKLLVSLGEENDAIIQVWLSEPFTSSAGYPEALIYETMDGHLVRSKSEMIIADGLFRHKIPYRYEQDHYFNYRNHCTDFTILHPIEYEEYYWEHFGLLDDESYSSKMGITISDYAAEGYMPMKRLITTFENRNHPLASAEVEEIIENFFVS